MGQKIKGVSKFAGLRGSLFVCGFKFFQGGVWIPKKERPSSSIGKYQFFLILPFQRIIW